VSVKTFQRSRKGSDAFYITEPELKGQKGGETTVTEQRFEYGRSYAGKSEQASKRSF